MWKNVDESTNVARSLQNPIPEEKWRTFLKYNKHNSASMGKHHQDCVVNLLRLILL